MSTDPKPAKGYQPWTLEEEARAERMLRAGCSKPEIAATLERSKGAIESFVRRLKRDPTESIRRP